MLEDTEEYMVDGVIAQDQRQYEDIWLLRESISESYINYGYTFKYDVSLPTNHFYELVEETRRQIKRASTLNEIEKKEIITNGHGHIGDGNLHLNVAMHGYDDMDLRARL